MNRTAPHAALRELLWEWDPIGVADCAPHDEYDCMIQPLLDRLAAGADQSTDPEHMLRSVATAVIPASTTTSTRTRRATAWLAQRDQPC